MAQDDFAFPQHLVRGLGAAPGHGSGSLGAAPVSDDANAVSLRPDLARFVPSALPASFSPLPCGFTAMKGKGGVPTIVAIKEQRYLLVNTTEWPNAWTASGLSPAKLFEKRTPGYYLWLATGDIFYLSVDSKRLSLAVPSTAT